MIPKVDKSKSKCDYIRVGTDYFKVINKPDRFGILFKELKRWTKDEIKLDHGPKYLYEIPKFDDFIIEPNNNGINPEIDNCYNLYAKFTHEPSKQPGEWIWTFRLMKHIFGNQFKKGMIYMQVLYLYPKQALPILVLVSKTRQTGKSTFLDYLNMLFGSNMVLIEPDVIGGNFNGEYAKANIIGIDETILDKQIAVEKIKSLATKKFISVNSKFVSHYKLPFFGKILMASNNEERFMKIEDEEIRFWIRKIPMPRFENHNILNDMVAEIPYFLNYLVNMPPVDFTKSRMVFTQDEISNTYLEDVKRESRTGLYHEIFELFTEFFNTYNLDEILCTPIDIKNRFFAQNNQVSINYIRRTMKNEFKFEVSDFQRYMAFGEGDNKPGAPFICKKEFFTQNEFITSELPF